MFRSAFFVALCFLVPSLGLAWENHTRFTELSLQTVENWEILNYEPIEQVLPLLHVGVKDSPKNLEQFIEQLVIQENKVQWTWSEGTKRTALDVLTYSAQEPDFGMDQELRLADYQDQMGGYTGLSSQAVRHMYFGAWRAEAPIISFHLPMREMGFAPERAQIYFELASQCKQAGHVFWAYRFLGWGLHYVQDMGQPYHVSQIGSLRLLGYNHFFTGGGWKGVVQETTRLVANYHLFFEQLVEYVLKNPQKQTELNLDSAFLVSELDPKLKSKFEDPAIPIEKQTKNFAQISSNLVAEIIERQNALVGDILYEPSLKLADGFYREDGSPKIDLSVFISDEKLAKKRQRFFEIARKAVSNTAFITLWYLDRFKNLPAARDIAGKGTE